MSSSSESVGLPEALERAAGALPGDADDIRPANGDPTQLLSLLPTESAARVLGWLLVNEPDAGGELADAWIGDPEQGAAALLAVSDAGLPKSGRKVLRRVRHRLRSRGMDVPGDEPAPFVATLPQMEDELSAALLSAVDPRGSRVAYLVEPHPSGGARLFEVILDEERGIVECEVYNAGRSKVRKLLRELRRRERFQAVEAPPEAVHALLKRVSGAQPAARPLPRGFSEWRSRIAAPPEGTATPGEMVREALVADDEGLERAAGLVRERKLGPWPPATEVLQAIAEKIAEVGRGQIVVSGVRRQEQIDQVLGEAVASIFVEPFVSYTAARFDESAYVAWKGERTDEAQACLAAADRFRAGTALGNPVARAMLEVVLEPALQKASEETPNEGEDPPSLIVKP